MDFADCMTSAKFFVQHNISPIDASQNFLIHMIPLNIAMKNVDKFALGHSQR